jgi:DNA-binding CsgD family transcriptional regulator
MATSDAPAVGEPGLSALEQLGQVVYGFHADAAGRVLIDHVSPGLEALLGRSLPDDPQELAAIWTDVIHAADRAAEAGFMAAVLDGEERWVAYRIARPDGDVAWLLERGTPVRRDDGLPGGTAIVSAAPSMLVDVLARSDGARPAASTALTATAYTAELLGGQLVARSIGSDWQDTTGLARLPELALDALAEAVLGEDREVVRERLRCMHAGQGWEGTYRIRDQSGNGRWLQERVVSRDEDGVTLLEGVVIDATRQHALEHAMRDLDGRLRGLLDSLDAHIYTLVVDGDGATPRAEFLGPRLDVIYGRVPPPDVDVDRLWERSVHPDDRPALTRRLDRLRQGHESRVVYRIEGLDGVTRWIRDRARSRVGDDGRLRIDGIAAPADVNGEATDELRDSRQLERVLSELEDTVFELEHVDGAWRAVYASPGIFRLLGGRPHDGVNLRDAFVERLHPDDREAYFRVGDELLAGRSASAAVRFLGLDGRLRRVVARAHRLRRVGDTPQAVGVVSLLESAPRDARAPVLTARQLEVLALLAEGHTSETIAADLVISVATVRNHVTAILRELGAHSRLEAVAEARRRLLV